MLSARDRLGSNLVNGPVVPAVEWRISSRSPSPSLKNYKCLYILRAPTSLPATAVREVPTAHPNSTTVVVAVQPGARAGGSQGPLVNS